MAPNTVQDILAQVEKPSRYLGSEINAVRKPHDSVELRVALAFPDYYEIGMSHFGLQILYTLLNRDPRIAAERVFAPGDDLAAALRQSGLPLFALESGTPLGGFDIIGFSLLYELNYTNILRILDLAGIPFRSGERNETHPLVIAGGPCTCNPEPVADFFDAMVIGDGESVMPALADAWIAWRKSEGRNRESLLAEWSRIEGVYVPKWFSPTYDAHGFQTLTAQSASHVLVRRAVMPDLDAAPFPDTPIVAFGRPIHDRLRLEVARGCTRGCRFCQAGMIYRPVRERSMENLLDLSARSLAATGYEDVSLLSLSTGDHSAIEPLLTQLMDRYEKRHCAVSFPSLRVGTLTPELMALVKRVRKTGFTIAVEAGSQRLRNVINKTISEEQIRQTVETVFAEGWNLVKLYFMVGLPTETESDLSAIVDLVKTLRAAIRKKGGARPQINVSAATFIPKPHTPFQWCGQETLVASREKIEGLKKSLRLPGIQFKWQDPRVSRLEGLLSRGDRRLSRVIETAYRKGCRFDGWSDRFQPELWEQTLLETGIDADFFITRERDMNEPLPWDHIDIRVGKEFFLEQYRLALEEKTTDECRDGRCRQCGVCDFNEIRPRLAPLPPMETATERTDSLYTPKEPLHFEFIFQKTGSARFFGHLEMAGIISRAVTRSEIAVQYSAGFHPMPKIGFDDPLPVGMESRSERFHMAVTGELDTTQVVSHLNRRLPEGLQILSCRKIPQMKFSRTRAAVLYEVSHPDPSIFPEGKRVDFLESENFWIQKIQKNGIQRHIDIKPLVKEMVRSGQGKLNITIVTDGNFVLRPGDVLAAVFGLTQRQIRCARVVKTQLTQ